VIGGSASTTASSRRSDEPRQFREMFQEERRVMGLQTLAGPASHSASRSAVNIRFRYSRVFFEVALLSFGGCGVVNRLLPYA
jgi:hypothetical protein